MFKPYDVRPSAWTGRKCLRCDVASRLPQPADSLFANGESKGLNAGSKPKKKAGETLLKGPLLDRKTT